MKKLIISLFLATLLLGLALPQKTNAQVNVQDSLALVALYNSTNGNNWQGGPSGPICNQGWLQLPVDHWYGITVDSGRVTEIFLGGGIIGYDCELTGTIPPEIGNLTKLKNLDLSKNNLTGQIPIEIYNLSELKSLYLYNNNLSGDVVSNIGNLVNLQGLDLSNNQLSGELPTEVGNLTDLTEIGISLNNFYGGIPLSILNLHMLNSLLIGHNLFVDLPDITILKNYALRFITINNNKLTFEDIEPNIIVAWDGFDYFPQDSVFNFTDTSVFIHTSIIIDSKIGGIHNIYQWKKNGNILTGATDSVLAFNDVLLQDLGIYTCEITNSIVPNIIIYRRHYILHVIDTASSIIQFYNKENVFINYNSLNKEVNISGNISSNSNVEIFNN